MRRPPGESERRRDASLKGLEDQPWKKMDETIDSTVSVANETKATLFAAKAYATGKTTEAKSFDNRVWASARRCHDHRQAGRGRNCRCDGAGPGSSEAKSPLERRMCCPPRSK